MRCSRATTCGDAEGRNFSESPGWRTALLPLGRSAAIAEGETTPNEEILDVSHWRERFDRQADYFLKYNLDRSRTGDSYSYYDMAYGVGGYVAMFEATGDEGYLDEALGRLIDNAISDATP